MRRRTLVVILFTFTFAFSAAHACSCFEGRYPESEIKRAYNTCDLVVTGRNLLIQYDPTGNFVEAEVAVESDWKKNAPQTVRIRQYFNMYCQCVPMIKQGVYVYFADRTNERYYTLCGTLEATPVAQAAHYLPLLQSLREGVAQD